MKYLLSGTLVVIFLKRLSEKKLVISDLFFVSIYFLSMNILDDYVTFQFIMALINIWFIKVYIKKNKIINDKSYYYIATIIQYCISFSYDLLPFELFAIRPNIQPIVSFLLFALILLTIDKSEIIKKNNIDNQYKILLSLYMIICLAFVYYIINKLSFTESSFLIVTLEMYFFLSTIVFAFILGKIVLNNEEIRMKEIENIEFKHINEQYNVSKYKSKYLMDIKHDLYYIKTMFEKNKSLDLSKQVDKVISSIDKVNMYVYTSNIMMNSLINKLKSIAGEHNKLLNLDIRCSLENVELGMRDYDTILELAKYIYENVSEDIMTKIENIDSTYIIEFYVMDKNLKIIPTDKIIVYNAQEYLSIKYIIE